MNRQQSSFSQNGVEATTSDVRQTHGGSRSVASAGYYDGNKGSNNNTQDEFNDIEPMKSKDDMYAEAEYIAEVGEIN